MDKAEAIERLGYQKARAQIALEQEVPEWIAEDLLGTIEAYDMAIEALQTEPKRGEWIDMGDFEQCSVCKGTRLKEFQSYYGKTTWIKTPYCPNCGADMRKESE